MIQLIKRVALDVIQSSNPVELMEAVVVSEAPDLKIKLKDNSQLILPKELILIGERLETSGLKINDKIMVASVQGGQSFFVMDRIAG